MNEQVISLLNTKSFTSIKSHWQWKGRKLKMPKMRYDGECGGWKGMIADVVRDFLFSPLYTHIYVCIILLHYD